jgi:hypothetical protein
MIPLTFPLGFTELSEHRILIRYERTFGTSVLPNIPCFIYHRLQNYQLRTDSVL